MKEGYIPISRKLFESLWWLEEREFIKAEAWLDMIQSARFEASSTKMLVGCKVIEIGRGEFPATIRFLAKRWGWNKNRVDRFLKLLIAENMITTRTAIGTSQTVIKLCNYDDYNPVSENSGQKRDKNGTILGQRRDNSGTKNNKVNKDNNIFPLSTNVDIPQGEDARSNEGFDNSGNTPSPTPQFNGTPSPEFMKFQKWLEINAPRVAKMKEPFSEAQFSALKKDFSLEFICNLLRAMHNYEPLLKKNRSANLTFRQWAKREQSKSSADVRKLVPKSESEKTELLKRLENNG